MKTIILRFFQIVLGMTLIFLVRQSASQSQKYSNGHNQNLKKALSNARSFEDIFVFAREIKLKVNDVIGEITQLEVASNGNLLVVDRMAQKTWLFDREGNLIKDISAEKDYPGIKWRPMGGWFGQNKTILIQIDGTHNLFLFDSTGKYIKVIPIQFPTQYRDFVISDEGYIYGYCSGGDELAIKKLDPQGKILATGGIFPKQFKNFLLRSEEGGLIIDKNRNLYQYNSCGPEIYKFSADLTLLKVFDRNPSYYKRLAEDYPDFAGDPVALMKKVNQLRRNATITFTVHLLKDSLLVIQDIEFGVNNGTYLNLYSTSGHIYTTNKIAYGNPILAARGYFVYTEFQKDENAGGDMPNPSIHEYRFRYE